MRYHNIFLRLALIFSETCFLILLYLCLIGLFDGSLLLNPLLFFVLSGVLTFTNIILATLNFRRLTITGVNLFMLGLLVFLASWQTGFILFSIPHGGLSSFNILLVDALIVWLGFRSIYLAHKKSPPDIYSHFDLYVFLTFLVFLSMGVGKIALPGGITWIIVAIFLNLLPLYIDNNTGEKVNPLSGWILAIAMSLLLYLSVETVSLFPHIAGTAGSVFGMFEKFVLFLLNILVSVLLWNRSRNRNVMEDAANQSAGNQGANLPTNTDSAWQHILMQGVAWFLVIMVGVFVVIIVYHFIRFLISWLLQRQAGYSRTVSLNPLPSWKELYSLVLKKFKEIGYFILLFLPGRMTVDLAYGQLLRWGTWKKCPRQIYDTPYDYYQRLVGLYPELRSELKEITSAYVVYRYSAEGPADRIVPDLKPMVRTVYLSDWDRLVTKISVLRGRSF